MSGKDEQHENDAGGGEGFKAITTQEEFDAAIKARIERAKKAAIPADYEDLKAKAAKFDEIEEQNKSDLEKATERAEAAEKELAGLRHSADVAKWKAAASKATGVPVAALRGDTEEEITAHAEAIKAAIPIYPQVNETGTNPPEMTKDQILAIKDRKERRAAMLAHIDLF